MTMGKVSEGETLLARICDESRPPAILNECFGNFLQPLQQILGCYLTLDHDDSLPLPIYFFIRCHLIIGIAYLSY